MNFLIIINHSKEYKDFWAFFKHFNNKENIFPLGCTNQMNSTQIDTNNNGGEFLYIQLQAKNEWLTRDGRELKYIWLQGKINHCDRNFWQKGINSQKTFSCQKR